ncbi:phage portal protein [Methylobacterium sp. J-068]|uniref:phage portal protein n=1 Tax=Methylobacterium sp. J-068 TaxID=2836649 RepID=UPI001FB98FC8|nr:phage portal protein [Methylobacterium sp. J-068]MCJ2033162.1 phage portal protein [Methylobacterium sp. J-068]
MCKKSRRKAEQHEEKAWTLDAPGDELLALFGAGTTTASGEAVGPESALRVPAVVAAVRTIAETLSSLPIHVYRRGADGSRQRDRDHAAAKVLDRPAPWLGPYEFKLRLIFDAIRHGQAFAVAARAGGTVRELHRIVPGGMRVEYDSATGEPNYKLSGQTGGDRTYRWSDVVHLVPVPSDGAPVSLISLAREAIGFASTLEKHGARLFGNGARPSGILSFEEKLSPVEIKNRVAVWNAVHGGGRSGGTAVMDRKATYTGLTLNSVDLQYLELRRHQVLEIARVFRVPPHMLAEMDRATHANSEELGLQFVAYCIRPWCDLIEGALSRVLFSEAERDTHFVEFQLDDLLRGNILQRFDALNKAIGGPWLTPNEGRAVENRPDIEGGSKLNLPQGVAAPSDAPATAEPHANLRAVA